MLTIRFRRFGRARRFRPARVGLALLLVFGTSLWASGAVAQVRTPTHVACVGDSITYGYMASSASASYPSVLQNLFGSSVKVMNYGHNSATMLSTGDLPYPTLSEYTASTTFVSGAGSTAVVDVIIMLGTNDSKSYNWMVGTGTRAQQFVTDCGAMVDHFASLPTHPVVYLALPPRAFANTYGISGTIIHDQILPLIQQVATAKGVPIIDVDTPTASHPELFPDGVHPNDTGYALVAKVMHDGLLAPRGTGGQGGQGGQSGSTGRAGASGQGGQTGQGGKGGQGGKSGSSGGAVGSGGHAGGQQGGAGGTPTSSGHGGAGGVSASGGAAGAGQAGRGGDNGSGGSGGNRGMSGAGGTPASGDGGSSGGSAGASTGGAGDGAGGTPTEVDAGTSGSTASGCSCSVDGPRPSASVCLLLAGLAALAFLRRRRRPAR
jgi:MYXO-CTERM domain-containing protein